MKKIITFIFCLLLSACQTSVETPDISAFPQDYKEPTTPRIPVVGGVETLYILPIEMPFHARMDTGAETSSIDAQNITPFERDGEKWISCEVLNRKSGKPHRFENPIKRTANIIRTGTDERRYVVSMSIKMGNEIITADFSLNDRNKFEYQILIGRNIINGRFVIDPSLENTMH